MYYIKYSTLRDEFYRKRQCCSNFKHLSLLPGTVEFMSSANHYVNHILLVKLITSCFGLSNIYLNQTYVT